MKPSTPFDGVIGRHSGRDIPARGTPCPWGTCSRGKPRAVRLELATGPAARRQAPRDDRRRALFAPPPDRQAFVGARLAGWTIISRPKAIALSTVIIEPSKFSSVF